MHAHEAHDSIFSDTTMSDTPDPPLHYYGGPRDGELVTLEPGWPAPEYMGHVDWLHGHYALELDSRRYVWRSAPLPGRE